MKLYHLLLSALILQILVFLPPIGIQRAWFPQVDWVYSLPSNLRSDDSIFTYLDGRGIGPYLHFIFPTGETAAVSGVQVSEEFNYTSVYLGNLVLSILLTSIVLVVRRIEHTN
jgi:hypothetical protein